VGAGAGSLARWLCARVGPSGRVVATDLEVGFLREIDARNLEVRRHDVRVDPLEAAAFDLVHARKVLEHLPGHDDVLRRMVAATRPGGFVAVEDADLLALSRVSGVDAALFRRGYDAFVDTLADAGYQPRLGLELGDRLRAHGLLDVQVRGSCSEWTGAGDAPSTWVLTFQKIRERIVASGRLLPDEAEAWLAAIRSPSFRAITGIHFVAWGRRPEPGA
jgi:SAM-dependent methyltransferase